MMMGSYLETSWNPNDVGDNGTSFGPFQMHIGGELTAQGGTPQQAEDPVWAAQHMLDAYTRGVNHVGASLWNSDPEKAAEMAAVYAEVPAQDYYSSQGSARVDQAWNATQKFLGGSGVPNYNGTPGINQAGLSSSILDKLLSLFGVPDIKDLAERGGLIIFGGILVLVGLFVATKKEDKVKEVFKEQLPGGKEETVTKEEKKPAQNPGPLPASPGKAGPIESNLAPEAAEGAEVAAVAV